MSGSISRRNIQLDFSGDSEPLRAQDIPYDASTSTKSKIDALAASGSIVTGSGKQWGHIQAYSSNSTYLAEGILSSVAQVPGTAVNSVMHPNGIYRPLRGIAQGMHDASGVEKYSRQMNMRTVAKILWADPVADGFTFGFNSTVNILSPYSSNNPSGSHVCAQFRNARDTNIQLMTKDGTTQNLADTGVDLTPGSVYYLELFVTEATPSATLNVYDSTYSLLGSAVSTANLPASTTSMRWEFGGGFGFSNQLGIFHIGLETDA